MGRTVPVLASGPQRRTVLRSGLRLGLGLLLLMVLVGWAGFRAARNAWARSYRHAAQQALDQQDCARAQALLRICVGYWPDDPDLRFLAARTIRRAVLFGTGDPDWETQALRELGVCERLNYPPEDIELEMTLLRAMRGELDRVESDLLALLTQNHPDSPLILETLVPLYLARFHALRALVCVNQLVNEQPENAYAYYWRGQARELLLTYGRAIDDQRRALELKPDLDSARQRLAEDLLKFQRYAEAQEHFARLVGRQPDNGDALLGLARAYYGQGQLADAEATLDRLLLLQPDNGLALLERGKLALQAGRLEQAEHLLRKAVQVVPQEALANYTLAQCLLRQGRNQEAARYLGRSEQITTATNRYRKVIDLLRASPQNADLRAEAGAILLRHEQTAEGLGWLTSALQIDPYQPLANQALADYCTRLGQANQAEHHRQLAAQGMTQRLQRLSIPLP